MSGGLRGDEAAVADLDMLIAYNIYYYSLLVTFPTFPNES